MWKWLNELSVAARLLLTFAVTVAGVVLGFFVSIWLADFGDRVGALETKVAVAQIERAEIAEESRQRDEESRQRDEESRQRDEETHILLRTIVPIVEASNAETKLYVSEEVSGVKATIEVHGLEIENLKELVVTP